MKGTRVVIGFAVLMAACTTEQGGRVPDAAEGRVVDVRRIWDQAPHNAFTDLVQFKGRWFCVLREGSSHLAMDGVLRVITSVDGTDWRAVAVMQREGADLRDARIEITPDHRLMLSGAAAFPQPGPVKHRSMVWFSDDGQTWDGGTETVEPDMWLWRSTWHAGLAYGIAYATSGAPFTRLYSSADGKTYQTLVATLFDDGYSNEHGMTFIEDGTCVCLLRRDVVGGDPASGTAQLGTAPPPYTQWAWRDVGMRIGGPDIVRIPDGRIVAAVRRYGDPTGWAPAWTALCWLDVRAGTLTEFLRLPSGGDTSYAGLVWFDGLLWVSYYSSHEEKTAVYLARVAFK